MGTAAQGGQGHTAALEADQQQPAEAVQAEAALVEIADEKSHFAVALGQAWGKWAQAKQPQQSQPPSPKLQSTQLKTSQIHASDNVHTLALGLAWGHVHTASMQAQAPLQQEQQEQQQEQQEQ